MLLQLLPGVIQACGQLRDRSDVCPLPGLLRVHRRPQRQELHHDVRATQQEQHRRKTPQ
jgi:hypothetical protein